MDRLPLVDSTSRATCRFSSPTQSYCHQKGKKKERTFNLIHNFVGRQRRSIQLVDKGKEREFAHATYFEKFSRLRFQTLGTVQKHELLLLMLFLPKFIKARRLETSYIATRIARTGHLAIYLPHCRPPPRLDTYLRKSLDDLACMAVAVRRKKAEVVFRREHTLRAGTVLSANHRQTHDRRNNLPGVSIRRIPNPWYSKFMTVLLILIPRSCSISIKSDAVPRCSAF